MKSVYIFTLRNKRGNPLKNRKMTTKEAQIKHIEEVKLPFLIKAFNDSPEGEMKWYYFDQAAKYGEIVMKMKNNLM